MFYLVVVVKDVAVLGLTADFQVAVDGFVILIVVVDFLIFVGVVQLADILIVVAVVIVVQVVDVSLAADVALVVVVVPQM